jgi:hypothetical protein
MKDIKDDSPCRTCSHIWLYHISFFPPGYSEVGIPLSDTACNEILNHNRNQQKEEVIFCSCKEYVPGDNLDYLEYKIGKKENAHR